MTHGQPKSREPDSTARWPRTEQLSDPIPGHPASPFEERFSTRHEQRGTAHVLASLDAVKTLESRNDAVVERQIDGRDTGRQTGAGHEGS